MNLIETVEYEGKLVCFASEIYEWFEVETTFEEWVEEFLFKNQKFEQTVAFDYCLTKTPDGETYDNYLMQIGCVIEVSMLQSGKKGNEARQFFIECEKITSVEICKQDTLFGFQKLVIGYKAKQDINKLTEDLENSFPSMGF